MGQIPFLTGPGMGASCGGVWEGRDIQCPAGGALRDRLSWTSSVGKTYPHDEQSKGGMNVAGPQEEEPARTEGDWTSHGDHFITHIKVLNHYEEYLKLIGWNVSYTSITIGNIRHEK